MKSFKCDEFIDVIKIYRPDKNSSVWWKLSEVLKINQFDESVAMWWKVVNSMKTHRSDENSSI